MTTFGAPDTPGDTVDTRPYTHVTVVTHIDTAGCGVGSSKVDHREMTGLPGDDRSLPGRTA
jgi:hypothetical protein